MERESGQCRALGNLHYESLSDKVVTGVLEAESRGAGKGSTMREAKGERKIISQQFSSAVPHQGHLL